MNKKNIKAFTLIELAIGASILGIALLGITLSSAKAREISIKNMVKELAFCYAQSRLNQIMSLAFTDPTLCETSNDTPSSFSAYHLPNAGNPYTFSDLSGIYPSGASETSIPSGSHTVERPLTEDQIGWKQIYSLPRIEASNPFPVANKTPVPIKNYIGKEYNDFNYFTYNDEIVVYLNAEHVRRMTFPMGSGYDLAMADDVDDFDGCWYTVNNVFNKIDLTVEVAVRPHFRNYKNAAEITLKNKETPPAMGTYSYIPTSEPFPAKAFDDMGEISKERFFANGTLNNSSDPQQNSVSKDLAQQFYHQCVFKEIVVTVSWVYPQGTPPKSITLFGVKPSSNIKDVVNTI